MNNRILVLLGTFAMLATVPAQAAKDCPGKPFRDAGASCAELGLHTDRAVCLPGQRFAVMCDDASRGRVRTCTSDIRCQGDRADRDGRRGHDDRRHDDDRYDDRRHDHGWRGDDERRHDDDFLGGFFGGRNDRRDGTVYFHGERRACETLRFDRYGEPAGYCARGTFNRDCRGNCERY